MPPGLQGVRFPVATGRFCLPGPLAVSDELVHVHVPELPEDV